MKTRRIRLCSDRSTWILCRLNPLLSTWGLASWDTKAKEGVMKWRAPQKNGRQNARVWNGSLKGDNEKRAGLYFTIAR